MPLQNVACRDQSLEPQFSPTITVTTGSCALPGHHVPKTRMRKGHLRNSLKQKFYLFCTTFSNPLHACCSLQELNRPEVTPPNYTNMVCIMLNRLWCPPALGCLRNESLCADCLKVGFLFRNAAVTFLSTAGSLSAGVRCLPAGMQHQGAQLLTVSSTTLLKTWAWPLIKSVIYSFSKARSLTIRRR